MLFDILNSRREHFCYSRDDYSEFLWLSRSFRFVLEFWTRPLLWGTKARFGRMFGFRHRCAPWFGPRCVPRPMRARCEPRCVPRTMRARCARRWVPRPMRSRCAPRCVPRPMRARCAPRCVPRSIRGRCVPRCSREKGVWSVCENKEKSKELGEREWKTVCANVNCRGERLLVF